MKSISSPDPLHKSRPARRLLGLRVSNVCQPCNSWHFGPPSSSYMTFIAHYYLSDTESLPSIICLVPYRDRDVGEASEPFRVSSLSPFSLVVYNTQRYHGAIGYVTPEQKHTGQAEWILNERSERKRLARLHRLNINRKSVSQIEWKKAA